jgi:hypothetical protein
MHRHLKIAFIIGVLVVALPALIAIPTKRIDVIVFYSETCGVCNKMVGFLEDVSADYPTMVIQLYDIKEEENKQLYDLFKEVYNLDIPKHPVPMVFIGKDSFRGYTSVNLKLMREKLEGCFKKGCTIGITVDQDCIVIMDSTPTPVFPVAEILTPFLVAAGVCACLNPYTSEVVSQVKSWKSLLFFGAYGITSVLLCFALLNVIFILDTVVFLKVPLVVIAVGVGVLSIVSVRLPWLNVPEFFQNAMDKLIEDSSGASLFSLGIGTCIASLVYTCGIYLLVIQRMLFFSLSERIIYFSIFNCSLCGVLFILYGIKPQRRDLFFVITGVGSIGLGIFFWIMW